MYVSELERYYNKFNEEKRLTSRHGQVEFQTTITYIQKILDCYENPKILDVGAGTGRYSVYFSSLGYDVTAVELVKSNLGVLKAKRSSVKAYQGNALDLSRFADQSFDVVLLLGPMYHLMMTEEQVRAMNEAKRVLKPEGRIFAAYIMNEFAMITHAFKEKRYLESVRSGKIDESFHTRTTEEDLYHYVRLEDIDEINRQAGVTRIKIIAQDGAANYIRPFLKEMDDELFSGFLKYHLSTCERPDLLGASGHLLDCVKKPE
ncbi:MAG: methyltransferase domain-containing protein [Erysipelotrichaceae bacterium]|nr:methyltransferase domain-containing protein [Erysipelotrichaceae bacterium]